MSATVFRRDRRRGKILGVCAGVAETTGVDVLLVRLGWLVLTLALLHGWGVGLYLLAAFLAGDRD